MEVARPYLWAPDEAHLAHFFCCTVMVSCGPYYLCCPSLQAILDANARGHKLLIMDARPKINALANQVKKN